jgi:hypothetical protein
MTHSLVNLGDFFCVIFSRKIIDVFIVAACINFLDSHYKYVISSIFSSQTHTHIHTHTHKHIHIYTHPHTYTDTYIAFLEHVFLVPHCVKSLLFCSFKI